MALIHPIFLGDDIWTDDGALIRASSAANSQARPPNRREVEGTAHYKRGGTYTGFSGNPQELRIKITQVGNMDATLSGVQTVPTQAIGGSHNGGNGTCVLQAASGSVIPADITAEYDGSAFDISYVLQTGSLSDDLNVTVDGTFQSIASGALQVKFTQGTTAFMTGDTFMIHTRQAQYEYSINGTDWLGSDEDLDDAAGGWQDNTVDFFNTSGDNNMLHGVTVTATLQPDPEPFVVDDIMYVSCFYRSGIEAVTKQTLFDYHKTRVDDRAMWLFDSQGDARTADMLAILHHNLTTSATIKIFGITDSDIQGLYDFTITSLNEVAGPITEITLANTHTYTLDDLVGGYVHVCTGPQQGTSYLIDAFGAGNGSAQQVDVNGTMSTDGVTTDDLLMLEPPDGTPDIVDEYHVSGGVGGDLAAVSAYTTHYCEDFTSGTNRGWVVSITDPTNTDGFIQIPILRMGVRVEPYDDTDAVYECHEHIDGEVLEAFTLQSRSIANIEYRYPRGVTSHGIPLIFSAIAPSAITDLKDLYLDNNNLNLVHAVCFWPDSSTLDNVFFGFMNDFVYGYPPQDQGITGDVSFSINHKRIT